MEIIRSNKGGLKLCFEGHMYVLQSYKTSEGSDIPWLCNRRKQCACKGRADTDSQMTRCHVKREHSHPPDHDAVKRAKMLDRMHGHVFEIGRPRSEVTEEALCGVDLAAYGQKRDTVKKEPRPHYQELAKGSSVHSQMTACHSERKRKSEALRMPSPLASNVQTEKRFLPEDSDTQSESSILIKRCRALDSNQFFTGPLPESQQDDAFTQQQCPIPHEESIINNLIAAKNIVQRTESGDGNHCMENMRTLYRMQRNNEVCDFVLCFPRTDLKDKTPQTIYVHKCILAAGSEKIRNAEENFFLFSENHGVKCVENVLEFVYMGEITDLSDMPVSEVLKTSKVCIELGVKKCFLHLIREIPDFIDGITGISTIVDSRDTDISINISETVLTG